MLLRVGYFFRTVFKVRTSLASCSGVIVIKPCSGSRLGSADQGHGQKNSDSFFLSLYKCVHVCVLQVSVHVCTNVCVCTRECV